MSSDHPYDSRIALKQLVLLSGPQSDAGALLKKMDASLKPRKLPPAWGPWEFARLRGVHTRDMSHRRDQPVLFQTAYKSPMVEVALTDGSKHKTPEFIQLMFVNKGSQASVVHQHLYRAVPNAKGVSVHRAKPSDLDLAIKQAAAKKQPITPVSPSHAVEPPVSQPKPQINSVAEAPVVSKQATAPVFVKVPATSLALDFSQPAPAPHAVPAASTEQLFTLTADQATLRHSVRTRNPSKKRAKRPTVGQSGTGETLSLFATKTPT